MNGNYIPFRVLKKKETAIMYVAIPDLLDHFVKERNECKSVDEEKVWQDLIERFSNIAYQGLDDDI